MCFKSVIQSGRSLFLSKIKNTLLKLPVGVSPFQLVNLHRNQRYFIIKLHTWFCLSYLLKANIKCYCIYQYFMSINSFFNTVSVSRYSDTADTADTAATSTRKVIKLHTWFCLSYFLKTNIKFYCIYQYFMSINSFSTPYLFLDTAATSTRKVIKLHTWFCLSYFLKTNIKFYCIYQYFMSINSFFNTSFFLIMLFKY